MKQRLVVIGNGMAGMKAVEELLEITQSAEQASFDITVFGAEPHGNYNRILLSPVLAGEKTLADIMIHDRQWYAERGITLHAGRDKAIVEIDRIQKCVISKDGTSAPYDRLLIATGSTPAKLSLPGSDLEGVISFRDIRDVEQMLNYSRKHRHAVVLGGGLLGLEAANGLREQGMEVTVVHNSATILNRQLDIEAGHLLQSALESRGIEFKLSARTASFSGDERGHVRSVHFSDGTSVPCDLFVMAIGVRPNSRLAQEAGIYCERGIVVNDCMQTYDPSIYAVGECVQHRGDTFGLVAPLYEQAKVCANHLLHFGIASYRTVPSATKLKVTGIHVFSLGDFQEDETCETLLFRDTSQSIYKKLVLKNNMIVGVVLYGDVQDGLWYQQLLESETDIRLARPFLIFGQAYAQALLEDDADDQLTAAMDVAS